MRDNDDRISQPYLSPEEYLKLETNSDVKHEYVDGEAFAMAGTTDTHNTIALNLATLIHRHLFGTDCRVFFADIKARLERRNRFYYPDLLVTCVGAAFPEGNRRDRETPTYKRFPKLVIEVLSEGTEAFDRGDKFNDYQTLESLEEYVLISSKSQRVEIFRRGDRGSWRYQSYTPNDSSFTLQSIDLDVAFTDLYASVSL